jgi:hypothetical protein
MGPLCGESFTRAPLSFNLYSDDEKLMATIFEKRITRTLPSNAELPERKTKTRPVYVTKWRDRKRKMQSAKATGVPTRYCYSTWGRTKTVERAIQSLTNMGLVREASRVELNRVTSRHRVLPTKQRTASSALNHWRN